MTLSIGFAALQIWRVMSNTLYATLNDTISLPDTPDSSVKTWMAMKRFVEHDQIVIVWRARVEIRHTATVRLNEYGWHVMRGLADTSKATAGNSRSAPCIVQTCIRSYSDPEFPIGR